MASPNLIRNMKSNCILKKILFRLIKNKYLNLIRYNKYLQKRIDIDINYYKVYYLEYFSSIEIEIKPAKDKYGKFINFNSDEKYYHIYFNDNKDEIKRNYLNENEKVDKINIIINYKVDSLKELFDECKCIESINFKQFYRKNINNMLSMFSRCSSLKELNLSKFNTDNVKNMSYMFYGCSSLKELNLSKFNTDNVTNMSSMFSKCSSLTKLNIFNLKTKNVTNMSNMFDGCSSLKELNFSNFNTNNVTNMSCMFFRCSNELKDKIKEQNKFKLIKYN